MLVGVISDTHLRSGVGRLPTGISTAFRDAELILHAGDIVDTSVLGELGRLAPVKAVAGNMDPPEVKRLLPEREIIEAGGHRIGLTHGTGPVSSITERVRGLFEGVSVIVFGHSHVPVVRFVDGILLMNPGSPTDRRASPAGTVGRLYLGQEVRGEIVELAKVTADNP